MSNKEEIESNVNPSTAKKFLKESGMHSTPDAVRAMQQALRGFAQSLVDRARARAKDRGVKTIDEEDILQSI